jgi:hypothetical protein
VAIYVFADDFHGSPDAVIKRVDLLASRAHLPKSAFRIHGIVFNTKTGIQTANFLRHLTAEYDGSMITIN